MVTSWNKPFWTLIVIGLLAWYAPSAPVDPWHVLNPRKIVTMVFALTLIQIFGSVMNHVLGVRVGAILTGFFGGLVSSTATTATLARKSKITNARDNSNEMLIFLSATGAMLLEGVVLVWLGTDTLHLATLAVFSGPIIVTSAMIGIYSRNISKESLQAEEAQFQVLPILKISVFIVSVLLISKLLQNFFGQNGLMVLTFFVSLFEIHGSIIANVQLHENGPVTIKLLSTLLAISILASYVSKLILISALGAKRLRLHAVKCSAFLFLSLLVSWIIALGFSTA